MQCSRCGETLERKLGTVIFESKVLGKVRVDGIDMNACNQCGKQLLFPGESQKVTSKVLEMEMTRVGRQPADQMVGEKSAARLLGISKQALHKSKKIRAGFIMSTMIDGHRHFLVESIFRFAETGDGRSLLDPISTTAGEGFLPTREDFLVVDPSPHQLDEPGLAYDSEDETFINLGDA